MACKFIGEVNLSLHGLHGYFEQEYSSRADSLLHPRCSAANICRSVYSVVSARRLRFALTLASSHRVCDGE